GACDRWRPFANGCEFPAAAHLDCEPAVAARTEVSCLALRLCGGIEDAGDGVGQLRPARTLGQQMLPAGVGEPIDSDALFVLGEVPLGGDQLLAFQAMECGIERAGVDLQDVVRIGTDRLADAITVAGSPAQGLENQ